MKSFARFKNEIWCIELAHVDNLAKKNNGVKYLLVRKDAKGMKTKDSNDTVCAFLTMITIKNPPKTIAMTREQNLVESLKKYAKPKEYTFTLQ